MGHGSADWRIGDASTDLIVAFLATALRQHDSRFDQTGNSEVKHKGANAEETPEFLEGHCLLHALESRVLEPDGSCPDGECTSRQLVHERAVVGIENLSSCHI
jgi:hypothetical protein